MNLTLKTILSALVASVFLLGIAAKAQNGSPTDEYSFITEEIPPLSFEKDGAPTGFAVELVEELKKRLGHHEPIEMESWNEALKKAETGSKTVLFTTSRTRGREHRFKWVGPIADYNLAIYIKDDGKRNGYDIADLKALDKIAVVAGHAAEETLRELGFDNLEASPEPHACARQLLNGWVAAWAVPDIVMPHVAFANGINPAEFRPVISISQPPGYIAFSKDTPDTVIEKWRETLGEIKSDGTMSAIAVKWLGYLPSDTKPKPAAKPQSKPETKPTINLTPAQRKWLDKHPVITVGPDPACPPLEYFDENGEYRGIAADYLKLVAEKTCIEFEIVRESDWDAVIDKFKTRRIDMLGAYSYTPERASFANFTKPYLQLEVMIIVAGKVKNNDSLEKFNNRKVGIIEGYAIHEYLENKYPKVDVVTAEDATALLNDLSTGKVEAVLLDMLDASYWVPKLNITDLKVAGGTGYTYQMAFAIRKDWPELAEIINAALANTSAEERSVIAESWMSLATDESAARRRVATLLAWLGAGGVICLAFIIIFATWNWALRRRVVEQTRELRKELFERKKTENQLRIYRDRLEEIVKAKTRELRASEHKYKALFEHANAAIFIIKDGKVLECNAKTVEMFGGIKGGLIEPLIEELSMPPRMEASDTDLLRQGTKIIEAVKAGVPQEFEWRHRKPDGDNFDAFVCLNRLQFGDGEPYLQVIVYDITDRKRVETELETAKIKAEDAARVKAEFLANMSHEIRTPLNAILGFAQILKNDPGLDEERREYMDIINDSGQHLLGIINQILEMSKIESGKVSVENKKFDIAATTRDIKNLFSLKSKLKGLDITIEISPAVPPAVKADEAKTRQILVNLVGNSIKFTRKGGIHISLDSEPIPGANRVRLKFKIEDTGPGFNPGDAEKLFQAFSQTTAGVQSGKGTGLGLAISRNYVELMGGDIAAANRGQGGAVFSFDIIAEPAEMDQEIIRENTEISTATLADSMPPDTTVLVAEDDKRSATLLKTLLNQLGVKVIHAADGVEAVELWRRHHPELVLMDIRMPKMDGLQATREIKNSPDGADTKIVAVSASVMANERNRVIDAGCEELFPKPIQEADFLRMVAKHLGIDIQSEVDADDKPAPVSQEDIPSAAVKHIETALEAADLQVILDITEEIKHACPNAAAKIAAAAKNFDYETIREILA